VNDDGQLITAALAGESAAFGELVTKYQDRLYNTIARATGSAEDAQDVVQEAFVQAYLKLATFQRASTFFTWICRIALNQAASRRRRKRPQESLDQARELGGVEPAGGDLPTAALEQAERADQVQAALLCLTEEHRTILVLREIDGCDYHTIGELLNLPVGTVRSRLFRARLQMRDQLKEVMLEDSR
jgi:RNA polymerase sigma-70 factor (ECF subfamily)